MWIRSTTRSGLIRRTRAFLSPQHPAATALLEPSRRGCFFNPKPELPKSEDSIVKRCADGFKQLRVECRRWVDETKDKLQMDPPKAYPAEIHAEFRFNNPKTFENFQVVTDKDNDQGFSTAELVPTRHGTGLFKGILNTRVPKDGISKKSGLAMVQSLPRLISFQRQIYYEWEHWTHLVVRCRGDGRSYTVNISVMGQFDIQQYMVYQYPLYTRGGPYWQLSYIPFSKFFLVNKGRVQDKQSRIPLNYVRKIGIALADANTGPFELEIDFIGFVMTEEDPEEFAYELYETPVSYGLGY